MDAERMSGGESADKKREIPAVTEGDFTNNFKFYKIDTQDQDVPVLSNGRIVGYFVGVREYERLQALKAMRRRAIATADLPEDEAEAIFSGHMDPRHDHLNKIFDPK